MAKNYILFYTKKLIVLLLVATLQLALVGCFSQKKQFNIQDDASKFEKAGYEVSVITENDEIHDDLEDTIRSMVTMGGIIDGTDLKFGDCYPLFEKLPQVCEKITGKANHTKRYEDAPYESMMIYYFETSSDAEEYYELFVPWFKIIQFAKSPSKEYTYGLKDNIVYVCTLDALEILMKN